MLHEPSLSKTKRLPAFAMFHLHMRIRITANILPPWVTQDCTGVVVGISLNPAEPRTQQYNEPFVLLQFLPLALYVKINGCEVEFLPPKPCQEHSMSGASTHCENCVFHKGVVRLKPHNASWAMDFGNSKMQVSRTQLPVQPEKATPLYSLQGSTTDPGMLANFAMPARAGDDVKFLIVYVTLSRVRSLANLRTIGLDNKIRSIIEKGPPETIVGTFERMFRDKINQTQQEAKKCRRQLGWPDNIPW